MQSIYANNLVLRANTWGNNMVRQLINVSTENIWIKYKKKKLESQTSTKGWGQINVNTICLVGQNRIEKLYKNFVQNVEYNLYFRE